MSDQMVAVRRTGLEQTYEELLKDLESLEHDLYKDGLSEESLFIDNIILRLKVWASDINIQGGSLVTIDKIGPLAMKIQSRLDDIRSLTEDAKISSSQKRPLAENKSRFLESLDSLAMFVEPVKTIGAQSSTDKKDHAGRIDAYLIASGSYEWARKFKWFLLQMPFQSAHFPRLLGAIVTNPREPTTSEIFNLSLREVDTGGSIKETVLRDFSISESLSKSRRSYTSTFGAPEVHAREIVNLAATFHMIRARADIRKTMIVSKSSTAFLVTGVMSAMGLSMDQIKSNYSWSKTKTLPSGIGGGAEAGSSSRAEEHISFGTGGEVIFAIKYQALRSRRFSKKLKPVDVNIKQNDFRMF